MGNNQFLTQNPAQSPPPIPVIGITTPTLSSLRTLDDTASVTESVAASEPHTPPNLLLADLGNLHITTPCTRNCTGTNCTASSGGTTDHAEFEASDGVEKVCGKKKKKKKKKNKTLAERAKESWRLLPFTRAVSPRPESQSQKRGSSLLCAHLVVYMGMLFIAGVVGFSLWAEHTGLGLHHSSSDAPGLDDADFSTYYYAATSTPEPCQPYRWRGRSMEHGRARSAVCSPCTRDEAAHEGTLEG